MLEPAVVRAAVSRVIGSRAFANAARSQRFLSWVIDQLLAGQQDSIKEMVLGIEVFDRVRIPVEVGHRFRWMWATPFRSEVNPAFRWEVGPLAGVTGTVDSVTVRVAH